MNKLLNKRTTPPSTLVPRKRTDQSPFLVRKLLYLFTRVVVVLALVAGGILLTRDFFFNIFPHASISAAPLLCIGVAYLGFQVLLRPKPLDLFKSLIVSSAFILWGIDQLLSSGWGATTLGDVVITLFVLDLGWMMTERLKQRNHIDKDK